MPVHRTLPCILVAAIACAAPILNTALANDNVAVKHVLKPAKAVHGLKHAATTKHGPRLARRHVVAPAPSPWSPWWSWSSGSASSSSVDDEIRRDDEMRRNDEFNRMMQQNSDAVNAAIQQANDMNAAATLQIQIQENIANMPPPQPN